MALFKYFTIFPHIKILGTYTYFNVRSTRANKQRCLAASASAYIPLQLFAGSQGEESNDARPWQGRGRSTNRGGHEFLNPPLLASLSIYQLKFLTHFASNERLSRGTRILEPSLISSVRHWPQSASDRSRRDRKRKARESGRASRAPHQVLILAQVPPPSAAAVPSASKSRFNDGM